VKATDAYGNVVTSYLGKVHFSDSASGSTLPADYTFTAADSGIHVFSVTLTSTALNTITVIDTTNALVVGSLGVNATSRAGRTRKSPGSCDGRSGWSRAGSSGRGPCSGRG
jgi:hypothetical protein